jgi:exonuclease III
MRKYKVDILFLQETIRQDFSLQELEGFEFGDKFYWTWLPAVGQSGGMLMGLRDSTFEVGATDQGVFFLSATILHRASRFIFEFIGVYGPADHSRSRDFLAELETKVSNSQYPVVVVGDFNLIRGSADKNNSNIDWSRVRLFNDSIARMNLGEIRRTGARFTWSNKQANPVRSVLDRVLVSASWEGKFPLVSLSAETRIGSDHTPLILDSGDEIPPRVSRFVFENGWLLVQGFKDILNVKWRQLLEEPEYCRDPVEVWHGASVALRSFLKGWSANLGSGRKREKALILSQI